MIKFAVSVLCAAAVAGMLAPASALAQQAPVPAVNESGSPAFDKLRNEAIAKKVPLVIYLTGSSWCVYCNIFTDKHIKERTFKRASGKKFIFWWWIPGRLRKDTGFLYLPVRSGGSGQSSRMHRLQGPLCRFRASRRHHPGPRFRKND